MERRNRTAAASTAVRRVPLAAERGGSHVASDGNRHAAKQCSVPAVAAARRAEMSTKQISAIARRTALMRLGQPNHGAAAGRDVFVVLHPARLLPWKGVHVSVDMLAHLRERNIPARLIITDTQRIVDWNQELVLYRRRILDRLHETGLADIVEFRSAAYDQMATLYSDADVVVYPTIGDEPFGLVPLEAMSMALPVIGSRSGGILETIVDGETGFLVDRADPVGLANCVERLFRDPDLRLRMGRAGRKRVAAYFNIRTYAADLLEDYSLAATRGRGQPGRA